MAGVGAVLGFVPQMLVLFLMLSILEDIGYMARVAFIMDRIFRKFGLSGKSFIPMLIGSGCGVPGVMASRTIENERDRRMTIMTTTFVPCGAKMPIVGLFAGALFGGSGWVAVSAYFIGIAAIILSGIILKKDQDVRRGPGSLRHGAACLPRARRRQRAAGHLGAGLVLHQAGRHHHSGLLRYFCGSCRAFGFVDGQFGMVEDNNSSILASIGSAICIIFAPLGFGDWQSTVAVFTGLIAKENVVSTFGVLFGVGSEVAEDDPSLWTAVAAHYTPLAAYSFMIFNLLCAPCFAAMGAIKREMNNWKWTLGAIGYMCGLAYVVSFIVYQIGSLFVGGGFGVGTVIAILAVIAIVYLLVRKNKYDEEHLGSVSAVRASGN